MIIGWLPGQTHACEHVSWLLPTTADNIQIYERVTPCVLTHNRQTAKLRAAAKYSNRAAQH
jgi:hypothetical protein